MLQKIYDSSKIWFTSDLHIFHKNIISICNRPYKDVLDTEYTFSEIGVSFTKSTVVIDSAINKMWEDIKEKWNKKVKQDDTVFILGDFIWNCSIGKCRRIMSQLNGKKVLIIGNHDKETAYDHSLFEHIGKLEEIRVQYPNKEWYDIGECADEVDYPKFKEQMFVLCHYPLASWNGSYRGTINLFGHSHNNFPEDKKFWNQMDIGWDVKYDLFSFDDIIMQIDKQLLKKHYE
jgi:calcineurin-like phosphoesterase family protein